METLSKKIDRVGEQDIQVITQNVGGRHYRIFEINDKKIRLSLVTSDGKLLTETEMNHRSDFNLNEIEILRKLSFYTLIKLSKEYTGMI